MKLYVLLLLILMPFAVTAQQNDDRFYELRIYYCHPGKLDDLVKRFTDHTTKIFEKHGMTNVGYWLPINNSENSLYYVLSYPDQASRAAAWKNFSSDTVWKRVQSESEVNGKIVAKVTSVFMNATTSSPAISPSGTANKRIFELGIYESDAGTIQRFAQEAPKKLISPGVEAVAFWTSVANDNSEDRFVYLLAYPNQQIKTKHSAALGKDKEWLQATSSVGDSTKPKLMTVMLEPMAISKIR